MSFDNEVTNGEGLTLGTEQEALDNLETLVPEAIDEDEDDVIDPKYMEIPDEDEEYEDEDEDFEDEDEDEDIDPDDPELGLLN